MHFPGLKPHLGEYAVFHRDWIHSSSLVHKSLVHKSLVHKSLDHSSSVHSSSVHNSPVHNSLVHSSPVHSSLNQQTPLGQQIPLIKQIKGQEGDVLSYDKMGCLHINAMKIGIPHKRSSNGHILTPIAPQTIPRGQVFLYAPHDRSFDSRYQEVGLVQQSSLSGLVVPLW